MACSSHGFVVYVMGYWHLHLPTKVAGVVRRAAFRSYAYITVNVPH